jgi:hypothetical protein
MDSKFMKALQSAKKQTEKKAKQSEDRAGSIFKRLSDDKIREILALEGKDIRRAEIAKITGVSANSIYNVVRRYCVKDGKVETHQRDDYL